LVHFSSFWYIVVTKKNLATLVGGGDTTPLFGRKRATPIRMAGQSESFSISPKFSSFFPSEKAPKNAIKFKWTICDSLSGGGTY
jgi:hypothetical protein